MPAEWIKKIPFFVRRHVTTKTIERIAHEVPDLYAVTKKKVPLTEKEELKKIVTEIFEQKMNKHNIK